MTLPLILALEKDAAQCRLLHALATRNRVSIYTVASCEDVLAALEVIDYSLLIVNWGLDSDEGLECARRVRALEQSCSRRIPIVAITAHALPKDRDRCLDAGMDEHLAIPFTLAQFSDLLERWVPRKTRTASHANLSAWK